MLPIVSHQIDTADARVASRQLPNGRPTPVLAGVIYEQNLIIAGHLIEDQLKALHQLSERGFRIIYGDYHRDGQWVHEIT